MAAPGPGIRPTELEPRSRRRRSGVSAWPGRYPSGEAARRHFTRRPAPSSQFSATGELGAHRRSRSGRLACRSHRVGRAHPYGGTRHDQPRNDRPTVDPDRRRRPRRVPGGRPRPAPPLRRGLPHRPRRIGRTGPRRTARDEAARRRGRGAAGRLPDAADERPGVPRSGDGPLPGRAAGAADRLRRHRRRDRGDQRRRPRLLPAQAVGSAGGEAVPGDRRAARVVGGRSTVDRSPRPRSSATAGRPAPPRSASSWPATRCRTGGTRRRRRRASACSTRPASTR